MSSIAVMTGVYGFLYAPILLLVVFSFNDSRFTSEWHGFTLRWYGNVLGSREWLGAAWTTAQIAVMSAGLATCLGTTAALGLERTRFKARAAAVSLLYLPIVVPDLILGISLAVFYRWAGIPIGKWTVVLAHVVFNTSFVAVVVRARVRDIPISLEEAALDLGATRWTAFWKVQLPLIAPGVLSGALLAFTSSLDDFVITYFTAGPGATTLSLRIFSTVRFGVTPEVNAVSALLLVNSALLVLLALALTARLKPTTRPA